MPWPLPLAGILRNARTMPVDATPSLPPRAVRAGLPGPWRIVFAVEIPICLGTCLLWLLAPAEYLGGFLGKRPHDVGDYLLLQQSTAVVFSMFVYFYGRVLVSRRVDLRTFRYLQEAMALGTVLALLVVTGIPGRVEVRLVSSPAGRRILCDSIAVGNEFQKALGEAAAEAIAQTAEADEAIAAALSEGSPNVLYILRGGLNFRLHVVAEERAGRPASVSFLTSERSVVDGRSVVGDDAYGKFDLDGNSLLLVADIMATGTTLINALERLFREVGRHDRPREVLVITVGTLRGVTHLAARLSSNALLADTRISVVLLEGAFGVYADAQNLEYHLDSTDFLRTGGVLTPEFWMTSMDNLVALFERCVIYDGGIRGFSPARHLDDLLAYWLMFTRLVESKPHRFARHTEVKLSAGSRVNSFRQWLDERPEWSMLDLGKVHKVYERTLMVVGELRAEALVSAAEEHLERVKAARDNLRRTR
ncbi:MAG: hypothetical protein JWR24_1307 [Actinoallomurus sp.]|nr:hypothetical protein [Actinoallomurus sp.]